MKKKYIAVIITCVILIAAGICYCVSYFGMGTTIPVITDLGGEGTESPGVKVNSIADPGMDTAATSAVGASGTGNSPDKPVTEGSSEGKAIEEDEAAYLYVHLCGAVEHPSVYRAVKGSRLVEIIDLAGGLTKDAAGDYINQAMIVEDGQRIYIPTGEEVRELPSVDYISGGSENNRSEDSGLIDINEADKEELMSLPGIGQAKADSIIEYRNAGGGFQSIEDLMNVPGIKEGLFHQVSSYITIK